jgi:hypothetical protein
MSEFNSDLGEVAFKLGMLVLKTELSKKESSKHISSLGGNEKEIIFLQKISKFWNQQNIFDRPDGLAVVTNYRFVFLSKVKTVLTVTDYLSFPYDVIQDIEVTKVMHISPAIRFKVDGKLYVFTFYSNANEVLEAINKARKHIN